MGGPAVLALVSRGVLVIAVEENMTSMQASIEALGFPKNANVVKVRSYAEAAGVIAAHREGINLEAITSHVKPIPYIEL